MKVPKILFNNRQKVSGIYCIKCLVSGREYIGSSKDMYNRLFQHRNKLRKKVHQNMYLQNAYNKYKEENFEISILEYCEEIILTEREQYYIDTRNPQYNITRLVERNILSQESRDKISKTLKEGYKSGKILSFSEKPIYVYDVLGNYITEFPSLKSCSKGLNVHQSSIIRVTKGDAKQMKGFQFSYIKLEKMGVIPIQPNGKAIRKDYKEKVKIELPKVEYEVYELTWNKVKSFNNIEEASEFMKEDYGKVYSKMQRKTIIKNKYKITKKITVPSYSNVGLKTQNMLETPEEDNQQR